MNAGERLRATYAFEPVDHLVRREFYIWDEAIQRWKAEGLPKDYQERNLFNFDAPAQTGPGLDLGWCEPPFLPAYEEKVVRDEGRTEIIQDRAGRWLRVFKGRRHRTGRRTCPRAWTRPTRAAGRASRSAAGRPRSAVAPNPSWSARA